MCKSVSHVPVYHAQSKLLRQGFRNPVGLLLYGAERENEGGGGGGQERRERKGERKGERERESAIQRERKVSIHRAINPEVYILKIESCVCACVCVCVRVCVLRVCITQALTFCVGIKEQKRGKQTKRTT